MTTVYLKIDDPGPYPIQAIKVVREISKCGLKEAKETVEGYVRLAMEASNGAQGEFKEWLQDSEKKLRGAGVLHFGFDWEESKPPKPRKTLWERLNEAD